MMTTPSDIAKSELVQFFRETYRRSELELFVKTFYPAAHHDLLWGSHIDVYAEAVDSFARRGLLDDAFFMGLYLCCPARSKRIRSLVTHFGIDPATLQALASFVPSLQKRYLVAFAVISGIVGILVGLALQQTAPPANPKGQSSVETGATEPLESNILLSFIQSELAECNEQYGQESEDCAQLAEALKSVNLSTCKETAPRMLTASKRLRGGSVGLSGDHQLPSLDGALKNYLDRKQSEQRTLRSDLQTCRSNLAKAQVITSGPGGKGMAIPSLAIDCPPPLLPECSPCSRDKPWSCKPKYGSDGTSYGCSAVGWTSHSEIADDGKLMDIPKKRAKPPEGEQL